MAILGRPLGHGILMNTVLHPESAEDAPLFRRDIVTSGLEGPLETGLHYLEFDSVQPVITSSSLI